MRSAGPSTSVWVLQPTSVEGAWNPNGLATQRNQGHCRLHRDAARATDHLGWVFSSPTWPGPGCGALLTSGHGALMLPTNRAVPCLRLDTSTTSALKVYELLPEGE